MNNLTADDIKAINDQDKLLEIIKNTDLDTRIRTLALQNIVDKSILRDLVHEKEAFLRSYAALHIDDDEIVMDLILNDSDDWVRHFACQNFVSNCNAEKYGDILLEFALENPEYVTCVHGKTDMIAGEACGRISDTSKLLKIITESQSGYVYSKAINKADNDALHNLLHNAKLNIKKKLEIAVKIEDDEKLKELLEVPIGPTSRYVPNTGDMPDDISGVRVMDELSPGDRIYTSIVFSYPNEEIVIQALNDIQYKSNLNYIIEHHKNPEIRDMAKKRLENIKRY